MDQPKSNDNDSDKGPEAGDSELSQSLKQLSITTSSSPARPPRTPRPAARSPLKPSLSRSPSSPRPDSAMRSPLNSSSAYNGAPSRSATPTLLRKASMNSLHSVNGVAPARRASSINVMSPTAAARSPLRSLSPELPERPVPTAASVASAHFKGELDAHHGTDPKPAETVVILHDACYGHRYSRPRTSRTALNTIVERPERIKACVLGVSAAYVRLGERHQDGAFPIHPRNNPTTLPSVPFRIQKTTRRLSLLSQTVTNVHGAKWMEELKNMCDSAEAKLAMNGKELQRPEMDRGGEEPHKLHEGDLYLCAESLDALEGALGGVCDAVDAVFRPNGPRRAFVAIRPPGHHCSASYPSGFCWINNVHVGIMHSILSHGLTHAAIIDFDLHHGDGSQSIAWQHNSRSVGLAKNAALWKKTSIGYFSLHDINSYPCEMGDEDKVKNASICIDNAHGQSIWNVHLQPWKTEADFWALYESKYSVLLEKTREYLKTQTERLRDAGLNSRAAIFLSAGFDASEWESPGMQRHNVNVPTEFYARLTRDVVRIAAELGTSVEGRIISVLEGGYSDRALCSGILSHISGLAGDGPSTKEQDLNGLGYEMGQRIGSVRGRKDSSASERGSRRYEPSWWSAAELERLENAMHLPIEEPRKPRSTVTPTYSSPTQSSSAKAVPTARVRRSVSGLSPGSPGLISRAPTPPPPDVLWPVAAHELSKLLIPSERQTDSCTHEDLNAEATRARRDRQSLLLQSLPPGSTAPAPGDRPPTRMSLRERKAKPTLPIDEEETEEERKNRRKTVAGTSLLASEKAVSRGATPLPGKQVPRQSGRRLSAASTIVSDSLDPVQPAPRPAVVRGIPRPDTSFSIRPESSMSVRTTAGNPLAVKKTRTPAKKEPMPRAPRVPKRLPSAANTGAAATKASAPTAAAGSKPPSPPSTSDDLDQLVSDMKKVKITLITPSQREARERERLAKERLLQDDTISVSTPLEENKPLFAHTPLSSPPILYVPETNQSPSSSTLSLGQQQQYFPDPHTPNLPPTPATMLSPHRIPLPSGSSSPVLGSSPTRVVAAAAAANDMFIQYQPEGPSPPAKSLHQNQPLQWMPPNVSQTPNVVAMRRGDLPVFTATSAIPFAMRPPRPASRGLNGMGPVKVEGEKMDDDVWQIPETPEK
ncbi:hypothetical protein B0H63DRAFT_389942 [Podospora didyma]|uniref:Histone deacetylase domain-containing protein n=1 Tax=Podospora didyma TaxID=330526 RepID=A0AAE0NZM5_9PEZI|nr:hypothetical protein B0H63DRAFT_389942 [Podospora didyma]